jgi:hypothetical protein
MAEDKTTPEKEEPPQDNSEIIIPEIPEKVLKQLPPETRKFIKSTGFSMLMAGRTPMPHPMASKVTSSHITKFLENDERENVRRADANKSIRRYVFWAIVLILVLTVGLIVTLVILNATNLIHDLIIAGVSLIGGFGSGFGVAWLFKK